MVILYKDPDGNSIMEKSTPKSAGSSDKKEMRSLSLAGMVDSDLDNKITSLRTLLKERDDKISELLSEIEAMKVSDVEYPMQNVCLRL